MKIQNPELLKTWLIGKLEKICEADPVALAKYVLALVKKDKPEEVLRSQCIDQLYVFLSHATEDFIDTLLEAVRTSSYEQDDTAVVTTPADSVSSTTGVTSDPTLYSSETGGSSGVYTVAACDQDETPPASPEPANVAAAPIYPRHDSLLDDVEDSDDDDERDFRRRNKSKPAAVSSHPASRPFMHGADHYGRKRGAPEQSSHQPYKVQRSTDNRRVPANTNSVNPPYRPSPQSVAASSPSVFPRSTLGPPRNHATINSNPSRPSLMSLPSSISGGQRGVVSQIQSTASLVSLPSSISGGQRGVVSQIQSTAVNLVASSRIWPQSQPSVAPSSHRPVHSRLGANSTQHTPPLLPPTGSGLLATPSFASGAGLESLSAVRPSLPNVATVKPLAPKPRCRDYDEKGFCLRGDACPFDHGSDPVVMSASTSKDSAPDTTSSNVTTGAKSTPEASRIPGRGPNGGLPGIGALLGHPAVPGFSGIASGGVGLSGIGSGGGGIPVIAGAGAGHSAISDGASLLGLGPGNLFGAGSVPPPGFALSSSGHPRLPPPILPGLTSGPSGMPPPAFSSGQPPVVPQVLLPPPRPAVGYNPEQPSLQSGTGVRRNSPQPYTPITVTNSITTLASSDKSAANNSFRVSVRNRLGSRPPDHANDTPRQSSPERLVSRTQSHSAGQSKPPASTGHDNSGRSADVATSSYTTPSVDNANNTSGTPNVTRRPFKHSDTICLRKVPPELNDLAKLGAHFQKFGKVVNIEVGALNDPQCALIKFSTSYEAKIAHGSPMSVLDNRFIRVLYYFEGENADNGAHLAGKPRTSQTTATATSNGSVATAVDRPVAVQAKPAARPAPPVTLPPPGSTSLSRIEENKEKKRQEALQKRKDIMSQKQKLLEKLVEEQKALIQKLEKKPPMPKADRDVIMQALRMISTRITELRTLEKPKPAPLPAPAAVARRRSSDSGLTSPSKNPAMSSRDAEFRAKLAAISPTVRSGQEDPLQVKLVAVREETPAAPAAKEETPTPTVASAPGSANVQADGPGTSNGEGSERKPPVDVDVNLEKEPHLSVAALLGDDDYDDC